jgi:hypothetical protein
MPFSFDLYDECNKLHTVWQNIPMAKLYRSRASLRLFGEDLEPEEITRLLCCIPTSSQKKGEIIRHRTNGDEHVAPYGKWLLNEDECCPGDLDGQIQRLLARVSADLSVWHNLVSRFRTDLFCGIFVQQWNEGVSLSPEVLAALGSRGIKIDFDIYIDSNADANTGQPAKLTESEQDDSVKPQHQPEGRCR